MFNFSKIFVTLFYIGYSKIIPGTVGSFFSFLIIFIVHSFFDKFYLYLIFITLFILSLYLINIYQKNIDKIDPPEVIIDEFLGIFIIFVFIEYFNNFSFYSVLIIGFIFFRLFDILKPFPIGWIDKNIKNSFGVIMDDIVAGIYSVACLKILNEFI